MTDLKILRQEIDKFLAEIMKENYLHFSGQKNKLEIKDLYVKYGHLFSKDLVLEIRDLATKREPNDTENVRNIFTFVLSGWIGESLKTETEELANKEAGLTIKHGDKEIPYRSAPVVLANIDDYGERKTIYHLMVDADKMLTDEFHKPRWKKTWEMTQDGAYGTYLESMEKVNDLDYSHLNGIMTRFIEDTDGLYKDVFSAFTLEKVGKPLEDCGYWDTSYLFRGKDFDKYFPANDLIPIINRFFSDFGFPIEDVIEDVKAIMPDIENRPNKVPRAFCAPVVVGEEVYINLQPMGGQKDYTTMLHEAGHAYHYAFADKNLPVEFLRLGDRAVSEGFAFLFNYLPENPEWCREYLGTDDPTDMIYSELRQKLFFLRRYGAKLAYEIELHKDNSFTNKDLIYKSKLQDAVSFDTFGERYLVDLDSGFYAADYLRAWIWEVQLRNYLEKKYGIKWFKDKNAGQEVSKLWKMGKKYPVEEMAKMIGEPGLSVEPLKEKLFSGLAK